ncbi:MAG: hypothetical protein FWC85_05090, partial [Elusimicrobia bacterium]|nr:hypothetical protein [Elusimicrobiota bacterium]
QKGEFATAKLNFQKVVSQRPYSVAANYMLAMIYEREENDTAALAAWQRVFSRARRGGNLSELAAKHIRQLKEIIGETR